MVARSFLKAIVISDYISRGWQTVTCPPCLMCGWLSTLATASSNESAEMMVQPVTLAIAASLTPVSLTDFAAPNAEPPSTNESPNCDTDWEEESIDSTCTSTSFDSTGSGNSDSTFHVTSEDEDEPDDSQDMYNVESNHEYPCQNMPSPQEIDETDDMSDGDNSDDDDVEEMYSDFNIDSIGQFRDVDYCDNENIDNLVCPGDVLEYCTIEDDQTARRSSVNTIIESGTDAYIVLEDGVML